LGRLYLGMFGQNFLTNVIWKSMFWCTLYMQSDRNINQEYSIETFHVIFWVSVKMIELRWKNN
jgi:hypothetical protein